MLYSSILRYCHQRLACFAGAAVGTLAVLLCGLPVAVHGICILLPSGTSSRAGILLQWALDGKLKHVRLGTPRQSVPNNKLFFLDLGPYEIILVRLVRHSAGRFIYTLLRRLIPLASVAGAWVSPIWDMFTLCNVA